MDDFIPGVRFGAEIGRAREVVLTHATWEGRPCLAKVPRHVLLGEEELIDAFVDNHRLAMGFEHPHLARVLRADRVGVQPYALLELAPGTPLARCGAPPEATVGQIARQLAGALATCHERGFVLLGLSARNVMWSDERGVLVTNYELGHTLERPHRAGRGLLWGDEAVIAPEQLAFFLRDPNREALSPPPPRPEHPPDARADVFAWGVIVASLVLGPRAFRARNEAGTLRLHREALRLPPGHPLGLAVRRATAPKPEARFAGGADLLAALPG